MEEGVLLGTKPLVHSIRHFIRDPSGVFSVCHLCECRIVQWRHDSRLLLLFKWFLHIIKRTLHVGSKIWISCSRGKNISHSFASLTPEILFLPLGHKIHIFSSHAPGGGREIWTKVRGGWVHYVAWYHKWVKQIEFWIVRVHVCQQGLGRPETHHANHEQTGSEKTIPEVGPG